MATQRITVNLPQALYEQLKQRAAQSQRSVEAELVEVVSTVVPVAGELTPALTELLTQLSLLDDTALWKVARRRLSQRAQAQLQSLNLKRQREGLTEAEAQKANALLRQYEQIILLRAQAAKLLKERGHDLTELGSER
jgi:plasmid stability protein